MKTLILDGSQATDTLAHVIHSTLADELLTRDAEVEYVRVAEQRIGPCMGDFFCWVRSPGICTQADDNRAIAQAFLHSDLVIFLTPVTFGGYSSELKRAVDHLIQLVLPFFARIEGETHHQRRYRRYPRLLAIGWLTEADKGSENIFHHLLSRNAINFHAPQAISGIVHSDKNPAEIRQMVSRWLDEALTGKNHSLASLSVDLAQCVSTGQTPRRAVLLVGSPRGKKSTSQALGGYLFERLAALGIAVETIRLYTVLKSEERQRALLQAISNADLVTVAFPLYVDSLPAPVIRMLEMIADNRRERVDVHPQHFAAIVNCGFPEAAHNQTAQAICQNFARLAGFEWAGGLSLGAGQGMVNGVPLDELGGRATSLKRALDMTAEALAVGNSVPPEAISLMATPIVPGWLYRLFGSYGWKQQARPYQAQNLLKARPYEVNGPADVLPEVKVLEQTN